MKENMEKIKMNKQLPYLVGNVVEILDLKPEVRRFGSRPKAPRSVRAWAGAPRRIVSDLAARSQEASDLDLPRSPSRSSLTHKLARADSHLPPNHERRRGRRRRTAANVDLDSRRGRARRWC